MNEKIKSIAAIMLIISTLSGIFLYWGIRMYKKNRDSKIIETAARTDMLIDELIHITNIIYEIRIDNILNDERVVEAFNARDREGLFRATLPWHTALKDENPFYSNMHFHLPTGRSFLRMHQPNLFGDDLKDLRPMITKVHETHGPVRGYEIGKHGLFYRVAKPVFFKGKYIGAVEIGIQAEEVAKNIERVLNIQVARYIPDYLLNDEFRQFCTNEIRQNRMSINPYTHKPLFETLLPAFEFNNLSPQLAVIQGREYILYSSGYLKDFKHETIGQFLTAQDVSKEMISYKAFVKHAVILTLILILGAFVILHFSFGAMINKIIELNQTLEAKVKERTDELKSATVKLLHTNIELNQILNTAADGMRVIGIDYTVIRVNDTFSKMTGKSRQELENRPCHEWFKGAFCFTQGCTLKRILNLEERIEVDVVKQLDTGETRSFLLTATPYKSPEGQILGVVENFKDITERKKVGLALARSEKRYRFIAEKTADVIWTSDVDLNSTYVSPSVHRLRGYTPEEDMAQFLEQKYTRESVTRIQDLVNDLGVRGREGTKLSKAPSVSILLETIHKNNSFVPVEVTLTPIYDDEGELVTLHGVSRDITERKKAYDALKENEDYLKTIMATVQTGVIVTDSKSPLIIDANPYAAKLMGCPMEDLLKGSSRDYFNLEKSWIQKALASRKKIEVEDYELRTAQGQYLKVRLSLATANVRGKTYLVQSFLDISDMKRLLEKQEVDIHMAKNIMTLINKEAPRYCELPNHRRLFTEAICVPCNAEGGDHYFVQHFVMGNGRTGKTFVSLKDQSGHEVNCILRSIFTDLLHNAALYNPQILTLEAMVEKLNNELCASKFFNEDDFFTAIHVELDHHTLVLKYISAGHPPFLLIRKGQVSAYPEPGSPANNLPMPFLSNVSYMAGKLQMQDGDQLIFYTDGLLEMTLKHLDHVLTTDDLACIVRDIIQGNGSPDHLLPISQIVQKILDHISLSARETIVPESNGIKPINTSLDDVSLIGVEIEPVDRSRERRFSPKNSGDVTRFISDFQAELFPGELGKDFGHLKKRVMMVFEESVINAWKHGNQKNPEKSIFVRYSCRNDFVLEVMDQGKGFDFQDLPDPTLAENITRVSGRGLFIVQHFSDHVQWMDEGRHIIISFKKIKVLDDRKNLNKKADQIRLWKS